jgi:hypothetical protein
MTRQGATGVSRERQAVLDELHRLADRTPTDALVPLLSLLGEITACADEKAPLTAGMVRRAIGRWRLLLRYAELREHHQGKRPVLLRRVIREAPMIAPGLQCSTRSLQRWVLDWNRKGPGGLAPGWAALVGRRGRPRKTRIDVVSNAV